MHGFELEPISLEHDAPVPGSGLLHVVTTPASPDDLISELAMNAIRDGVLVSRSDGRVLAVNQSICEMTGFARNELIGTGPAHPFWPQGLANATREGGGEYDVTLQRKSGEQFPAIVSVGVSPGDRSQVIVIKDITERVALTAEIHAAKQDAETVRLAFARSAELIGEFLYSSELLADGRYIQHAQGPGIAALLGSDGDPAHAAEAADSHVHPDDRAIYDHTWSFANLLQLNGQVVELRYRLVGDDDIVRWVRDRARITVIGGRVFLNGSTCDVSAQRLLEKQRAERVGRLEWLSSVDSLTGLLNRRHFSDLFHGRKASADSSAAIVLVDVDSFKGINDVHGHSTGDAVLCEVARRLQAATRGSDLIARWGGEEFCVLLGRVEDDRDLETQAERLRLAVAAAPIVLADTPPITVTVSVGIARAGRSTDDLFSSADLALYEAKRAGRNRTRIARDARRPRHATPS